MFDTEKDASFNSSDNMAHQDSEQLQHDDILPESQPAKAGAIDYKDLFLRLNADFQNHQKRVAKQKTEWLTIGQEAVILKVLPVLQDLERALNAAASNQQEKAEAWAEGLNVIKKNLLKTLTDLDVQEIETSGTFNPEFHEAIAQVESPNHLSGQIVDVVNNGYLFKGKVIKFAQVTIAK
jgi:molecular chaperone GrpE